MMPGRAPDDQVEEVLSRLSENGSYGRVAPGKESIVIGAFGDREMLKSLSLEELAGEEALCDAAQLLPTSAFAEFAGDITRLVGFMGKTVG